MEEESKKLQATLDELARRLDRHEWRIVDLEKRLTMLSNGMHPIENNPDDTEYKEPILKKASHNGSFTVKNKIEKYFVAVLIILALLCVIIGFVAMSYM